MGGTDFNQFDRIVVDEEVNLGGKLEVELIGNFAFEPSDEEINVEMDEIITSVFVNKSARILANGKGVMVVAGNGVA